jgi:dihydroxy-acid dehydratase
MEAIGLMMPNSSSNPADDPSKKRECRAVGGAVRNLLEQDLRPRDILTRRAFENATAAIAAIGGSTNGILHILALAKEAEIEFTLRDIQAILRRTPVLCSFAPRGNQTMADLHKIGGTQILLKHLMSAGVLHGDCMTVTGNTLAADLASVPAPPTEQKLLAPIDAPLKPLADMQICFGNLAPGGIVFKVSSMQETRFRGRAQCFSVACDVADAVEQGKIKPGTVIVLRYLGPIAAGMPEVLVASAALAVPELDGKVALVSDTRVSGVSHGAIGVHCVPEAQAGGPIALVEDEDEISFDLTKGECTLHVTDDVLSRRRAQWKPPNLAHERHYLSEFSALTTQADSGCVLNQP